VATDRDTALRKAEKLLRQGRLDLAIAEYVRVVEEQPLDLTTANALGDLYVRAGQTEQAVRQYARIAAHLDREGFLPKAAALYKKILKVSPDDEPALLRSADIAARQGLLADAKAALTAVAGRRLARGDRRGAAEVRARLGDLDPADVDARLAAAHARADLGEAVTAGPLRELANDLLKKKRDEEALAVLREALALDPRDEETRRALMHLLLERGEVAGTRELATDAAHFRALGQLLADRGEVDAGLEVLAEAVARDPADAATRAILARAYAGRGDWARAGEYLTPEAAGEDSALLLLAAEIELRAGRLDRGEAALRRVASTDSEGAVGALGRRLRDVSPEMAFPCVEVVADLAAARQEWPAAVAAVGEFVERAPYHLPALMKLVELCVDGGLHNRISAAQAQLADAYLAAGAGSEARVIAEDLVACEPDEPAHVERLRQALRLLGEADPERLIADRLEGQAALDAPDLDLNLPAVEAVADLPAPGQAGGGQDGPSAGLAEPVEPVEEAASVAEPDPDVREAPAAARDAATGQPPAPAVPDSGRPPRVPSPPAPDWGGFANVFELSASAIDVTSLFSDAELGRTASGAEPMADQEIDLSAELARLNGPPAPAPGGPTDLEGVFRELRDEVGREPGLQAATRKYQQAVECEATGREDEAVALFEAAARSPRLRFDAAGRLARLLARRERWPQAVEWFEHAAQAPAPTAEGSRALLYDLGRALERGGECARALAVYLELRAEAGRYRDVTDRIDRLSKSEMRG